MKQPKREDKFDYCQLCPFNGYCRYRYGSPCIKERACENYREIKEANEAPVKMLEISPSIFKPMHTFQWN